MGDLAALLVDPVAPVQRHPGQPGVRYRGHKLWMSRRYGNALAVYAGSLGRGGKTCHTGQKTGPRNHGATTAEGICLDHGTIGSMPGRGKNAADEELSLGKAIPIQDDLLNEYRD